MLLELADLKGALVGTPGQEFSEFLKEACERMQCPVAILHAFGYYDEPFVLKTIYNFKAKTLDFKGANLLETAHQYALEIERGERPNPLVLNLSPQTDLVTSIFFFDQRMIAFSVLLPTGRFETEPELRQTYFLTIGKLQGFLGEVFTRDAIEVPESAV